VRARLQAGTDREFGLQNSRGRVGCRLFVAAGQQSVSSMEKVYQQRSVTLNGNLVPHPQPLSFMPRYLRWPQPKLAVRLSRGLSSPEGAPNPFALPLRDLAQPQPLRP